VVIDLYTGTPVACVSSGRGGKLPPGPVDYVAMVAVAGAMVFIIVNYEAGVGGEAKVVYEGGMSLGVGRRRPSRVVVLAIECFDRPFWGGAPVIIDLNRRYRSE
jgi:hypothetical protein